jgi:hypothetical protein
MASADNEETKAVADEDDKKEPPLKGQLDPLMGLDIGKILSSKGPVVKCVLLKHLRADGKDAKPHPASPRADATHHRQVLTDLIEEIELDTTPSKNSVSQVLGGSFTFIGQFITEGTILMCRKELPDDETLENESIHALQSLCKDFNVDTEGMLEKSELVGALQDAQLVVNPHRLQPPLDGIVVRGDILILKVAETNEELDSDGVDAETALEQLTVPTNEEFFLNYTRDEYIAFASRTDVVAPEIEAGEDEDGEEEENDDEDDENGDEEYNLEEDEEAEGDEDYMTAMMNLILGEVLKKFRQENGRGPDTRELLELRSKVAEKLGVEVASFDEVSAGQKREAEDESEDEAEVSSSKKVKFSSPKDSKEDDDQKIKASGTENGGEKKDS